MDETYQTKAIILNRQPFREYDTKVSVFCLDKGKLELVARGTKKISSKLAGHLEPISLSSIMIVRGRQYDYLGSAINENAFINIKNDFDKLQVAGRAVNLFQKLVKENERDEKLFYVLENFLKVLNYKTEGANNNLLFNFFLLKLLIELGYKPELYNCVVCNKKIIPNNNKFDLSKGGVVHGSCKAPTPNPSPVPLSRERGDYLTITDNCIKVLRMVIHSNFDQLNKLIIDSKLKEEVDLIISSFRNYHFQD